jgi:hypothetical protein
VISTFNTCSQGPIHWSLTDTGEGYNQLRPPPGLRLSNLNIASSKSDVKHLPRIRGFLTTRRLLKPMSTASNANIIRILARSSRVISKGNHSVTAIPINSYQPNAQSLNTKILIKSKGQGLGVMHRGLPWSKSNVSMLETWRLWSTVCLLDLLHLNFRLWHHMIYPYMHKDDQD